MSDGILWNLIRQSANLKNRVGSEGGWKSARDQDSYKLVTFVHITFCLSARLIIGVHLFIQARMLFMMNANRTLSTQHNNIMTYSV